MANPTNSVRDDPMMPQGAIPHRFDEVHTEGPNVIDDETDDFANPIGAEHGEETDKVSGNAEDLTGRFSSIAPDQHEPQTYTNKWLFGDKPGIE